MKTISFKSVLQAIVFCIVFISSVIVSGNIYQNIKQVYESQPAGAGIACLFHIID